MFSWLTNKMGNKPSRSSGSASASATTRRQERYVKEQQVPGINTGRGGATSSSTSSAPMSDFRRGQDGTGSKSRDGTVREIMRRQSDGASAMGSFSHQHNMHEPQYYPEYPAGHYWNNQNDENRNPAQNGYTQQGQQAQSGNGFGGMFRKHSKQGAQSAQGNYGPNGGFGNPPRSSGSQNPPTPSYTSGGSASSSRPNSKDKNRYSVPTNIFVPSAEQAKKLNQHAKKNYKNGANNTTHISPENTQPESPTDDPYEKFAQVFRQELKNPTDEGLREATRKRGEDKFTFMYNGSRQTSKTSTPGNHTPAGIHFTGDVRREDKAFEENFANVVLCPGCRTPNRIPWNTKFRCYNCQALVDPNVFRVSEGQQEQKYYEEAIHECDTGMGIMEHKCEEIRAELDEEREMQIAMVQSSDIVVADDEIEILFGNIDACRSTIKQLDQGGKIFRLEVNPKLREMLSLYDHAEDTLLNWRMLKDAMARYDRLGMEIFLADLDPMFCGKIKRYVMWLIQKEKEVLQNCSFDIRLAQALKEEDEEGMRALIVEVEGSENLSYDLEFLYQQLTHIQESKRIGRDKVRSKYKEGVNASRFSFNWGGAKKKVYENLNRGGRKSEGDAPHTGNTASSSSRKDRPSSANSVGSNASSTPSPSKGKKRAPSYFDHPNPPPDPSAGSSNRGNGTGSTASTSPQANPKASKPGVNRAATTGNIGRNANMGPKTTQQQRRHPSIPANFDLNASIRNKEEAYWLLGLQDGADDAAIKKAYRKKALEWHPDRQQNHGYTDDATRMFQKIKDAMDYLIVKR